MVLLILTSPLLLFAAIGTLLTSGRPILFRQNRVGMDGHEFEILKFRTMRGGGPDPDRDLLVAIPGDAPGGIEGTDRRTRLGSFLRATSIDRRVLPQPPRPVS